MSRQTICLHVVSISFMHVLSIYLFVSGFFLTRYELTDLSSCESNPLDLFRASEPAAAAGTGKKRNSGECWTPQPRFKKVVILLIDALRSDFAHFEGVLPPAAPRAQKGQKRATASGPKTFYLNHLPVFRKKLIEKRSQSRLYRFDADPPTVTMQRLKGLITGGLPTFIDFKDNFGTNTYIEEDNLILQMKNQGKKIVFMGDDTWTTLFDPEKFFVRSYPYPSFDVKDLHTVDNGIRHHLIPEMNQSRGEWDVIIAHFLGVDHCGHRFGPNHPEMASKLDEMNGVVERVLEEADEDTLVAVFGDHGMNPYGDHGGASDLEVGSALFLYSGGKPLYSTGQEGPAKLRDLAPSLVRKRVSQIDLVPSLSLLLGLPIPYGNLGRIIPELFFHPPKPPKHGFGWGMLQSKAYTRDTVCESMLSLEPVIVATRMNAFQTLRYITSYDKSSGGLDRALLETLNALFRKSEHAYNTSGIERMWDVCKGGEGAPTLSESDLAESVKILQSYTKYLDENMRAFRIMWTQFDLVSMGWSIALAFVTVLCSYVRAAMLHRPDLPKSADALGVISSSAFNFAACGCVALGIARWQGINVGHFKLAHGLACFALLNSCYFLFRGCQLLGPRTSKGSSSISPGEGVRSGGPPSTANIEDVIRQSRTSKVTSKPSSVGLTVSLGLAFAYAYTFTSNSFMEAHQRILPFLIMVASAAFGVLSAAQHYQVWGARAFDMQRRFAWPTLMLACCVKILQIYPARTESEAEGGVSMSTDMDPVRSLLPLVVLLLGMYVQLWRQGSNLGGLYIAVTSASFALSFGVVVYWALVNNGTSEKLYLARIVLPRGIYAASVVLSFATIIFQSRWPEEEDRRFKSLNAAWLWSFPLVPGAALLLGPRSPLILLSVYAQLSLAIGMLRQFDRFPAQGTSRPFHKTLIAWAVLVWLVTENSFFATGHNSNFNGLHIASAYVGLDGFHFYFSGTQLFLNTFIVTMAAPVLVWTGFDTVQRMRMGPSSRFFFLVVYGGFYSIVLLVVLGFTMFARRHLMVWAIFAPKMIFTAATIIVIDIVLLLIAACCGRHTQGSSERKHD